MLKNSLISAYFLITLTLGQADIYIGTAGSMSYYQSEVNGSESSNSVGPDGSVIYTYPMGSVSARYSSQSRNWFIGETSQITRDIKYGIPQYNDDDIFTLDGVELVYSGGANPRLYHSSKENYAKIQYWEPNTASSYWLVYAKDGSIWYYGTTADSRIEAVNQLPEQPRTWAVAAVKDKGNFNLTQYSYIEDTLKGAFYLAKVVTGKTQAASNGYTCTKLFYESIPALSIKKNYSFGTLVEINKRAITVLEIIGCDLAGVGGVYKHGYKINWLESPYTLTSLINTISEYGTNVSIDTNGKIISGSSLPPTSFEYSTFTPAFAPAQTWACDDQWNVRYTNYSTNETLFDLMDINGDGRPDRIKQGFADDHSPNSNYAFRVQLNTGSGFAPTETWPVDGSYIRDYDTDHKAYTYDLIDLDGDGLPDRIYQNDSILFTYQKNNGHGFAGRNIYINRIQSFIRGVGAKGDIVYDYMDMNGDGFIDYLKQNGSQLEIRYARGHLCFDPNAEPARYSVTGTYLREYEDANGHSTGDYIDMNGDRLPDRVWQNNETTLHIQFNHGNGFDSITTDWPTSGSYLRMSVNRPPDPNDPDLPNPPYDYRHSTMDYMDINGDGLPDRLVQNDSNILTVRLNTGNGFGPAFKYYSVNGNYLRMTGTWHINQLYDYIDMDVDGMLDRIYRDCKYPSWSDPFHIQMNTTSYPVDSLLTKIVFPEGGKKSYTYKPFDRNLNPNYQSKCWVLDSITTEDGLGSHTVEQYEFSGGSSDTSNKKNNGFRKVKVIEPTGDYKETFYYQGGANSGAVEKEIIYNTEGKIFSYTYNRYENFALREDHYGYNLSQSRPIWGSAVIVEAIKLIETNTYLVDGTVSVDAGTQPAGTAGTDWLRTRKTCEYDDYGNITKIIEGDYTTGDWNHDKKETSLAYICDLTNWQFKLKRQCTSVYYCDYENAETYSWMQACEKKIYYDNLEYGLITEKGLPTKDEFIGSDGITICTQTGYDIYGNVISNTDANGNITTYEYDPVFHCYQTKEESPAVHGEKLSTITAYNACMLPRKITGTNGEETTTVYDVFLRKTKTISPGDSEAFPTVEYIYHPADNSTEADGTPCAWTLIKVRQKSGTSQTIDTYQYEDGLGRITQTKTMDIDTAGNLVWNTANKDTYPIYGTIVSGDSAAFYTKEPTFSNYLEPPDSHTVTQEWLDSTLGKATSIRSHSGIYSYKYNKLL
jgi:hypothetical protein